MVDDYCMSKAEEALSNGGGDHRRAAKLLRDWAKDDLDLQTALLQPFLGSLCALAIQRAAAQRARASAKVIAGNRVAGRRHGRSRADGPGRKVAGGNAETRLDADEPEAAGTSDPHHRRRLSRQIPSRALRPVN
ncbi:MAG: hypothetical protein EXQ89_07765 [Rhodospirillaceae bacterium]|nr:hypothetical protein [Rhodospirillaceae bacterium]